MAPFSNVRFARYAGRALLPAAMLLLLACGAPAISPSTRSAPTPAAAEQATASLAGPSPTGQEPAAAAPTGTAEVQPSRTATAPSAASTPVQPSDTPAPPSPTAPQPAGAPSAAPPAGTLPATPLAASPAAQPDTVTVLAPLLIDSGAGRLYAPARTGPPEREQTAVLSAKDGSVVALYDVAGPLGLDPSHGRLYVDQGAAGLAVLDAATGKLLRTAPLPAAAGWSDGSPAPQADPPTGQVLAVRNNSVYVVDGGSGEVLRHIDFDLRPQDNCRAPHDTALPIAGSRYDAESRILYLDFVTFSCIPWIGYTTVAFDIYAGKEIGRGGGSPSQATAGGGRQYMSSWYRMGTGTLTVWHGGQRASESTDWSGGGAAPYLDARRGRVYQNPAGSIVRVFDADTLRLLMVLPQPAAGQLAGYDPGTDQLYFLNDGRLQPVPAARLAAPAAQPPAPAARPAAPVSLLALSPGFASDKTAFGVWGWEGPQGDCYVFGQMGGLLLASSDGGASWRKPQAGLPGACAQVSALAVSPAYPKDHTIFVGITGSGLFRSTDGGALWAPASSGMPSMGLRHVLLSRGYASDHTVFAVGWSGPLQRSADGGQTWAAAGDMAAGLAAISPEFDEDRTVVAWGHSLASEAALRISHDAGERWVDLADPAPEHGALVGLSLAPAFIRWKVMFAVDSQGIVRRSSDGGQSWQNVLDTRISEALAAQILYGPGETNRPVFLLVTSQDHSVLPAKLAGKLFRSLDGGQTWQAVQAGPGIEPTAMALSPDFARDGLLLVGTGDGRVLPVKGLELPTQP